MQVDYASVDDKCLFIEDVQKSSKELWLIKAPHNVSMQGRRGSWNIAKSPLQIEDIYFFFFIVPWLKSLVEYSFLLPKYHVKISRGKSGWFLFYFTFCKGHFTCKSMEIGIIACTIALILKSIIKHILICSKKSTFYFFMKFTRFEGWMIWYILWRFHIREKSCF